ncbi:MAG: LPS-assembly protein LptD [Limnohabitans sp.]
MILLLRKLSPLGLLPAGVCAVLGLGPCWAHAQTQGLELRSSPRLQESLSPQERQQGSLHLDATRIDARPDMDLVLEGNALIRRPGMVLRADRIEYDQSQDRVKATGHVRIHQQGNLFEGPSAQLQLDSFQGQIETPQYRFAQGGHGDAQALEFIDPDRMSIHQARYTTCRATPGPEWLPEWFLSAARISTDAAESLGEAKDVQLHFFGLSSPHLPDIQFPLESNRSSGLLAPVMAIDSISGIDLMQPFYWDIAPNRDATLLTRAMSRRGMGFEGEFRYLEEQYRGLTRLSWLPHDALNNQNRWGVMTSHTGSVDTGLEGIGNIGTYLSINRVSDDAYWRDFPKSYFGGLGQFGGIGLPGSVNSLTQRILPSTGSVTWERDGFSMAGLVQRWQAQQDIRSPITPPYDRAPQITMRYGRSNDSGFDWSVTGDTTRFEADYGRIPDVSAATLASLHNGTRSYTQAQISRPWVESWGYITPKIQLHATRYDFSSTLSDGSTSVNRFLPTFSLDSGLLFERETSWLGKSLTQTLEPRIFYVRTPYIDQSKLPLYDTGITDFSLATIYTENPYVGQDRIADNNVMTFGVNSRFFDSASGAELLRLGIAQRLRFTDQRVSINPNVAADSKGLSDLLLAVGTRWTDQLSLDAAVQLNNQTREIQRSTLQLRYNPGPYRLLNAAYRFNKDPASPSELIDLGWQWPLSDLSWGQRPDDSGVRGTGQGLGADRWYSVGRMNYSLQDKQMVNSLIGLEYDAGCWLGRVVFERLQNTVAAATTRLMFQLELVGFGRVGVSPLDNLRLNIPRYQLLRENPTTPSRFLQYE